MSTDEEYDTLKSEFGKIIKRILKQELSKNPLTLKRYENELITAYNKFVEYIDLRFENLSQESRDKCRADTLYVREKTLLCFGRLNLTYALPNDLYEQLNTNLLNDHTLSDEELEDVENNDSDSDTSISDIVAFNAEKHVSLSENTIMTQKEDREFLRFAAQTCNKNYSGDPLTLKSFVNCVNIVKKCAEARQETLLKEFVVSRLEGKALECVDTTKSLDDIIKCLQDTIKPESSKVVEGKIMNLHFNVHQPNDFLEQAERLTEAFQRALVIEGHTLDKAKEMTVEKTVELCRRNTKNDSVDGILASKDFRDPKEVIAKMIVEQNKKKNDRQVLSFNRGHNRNDRPFFRRNNGNFNNNRGNWNRGGGNSFRGRSNRGRGRFNNNRSHNYANNDRRQYNVRVAENCDAPSASRRETDSEPGFTIERVARN